MQGNYIFRLGLKQFGKGYQQRTEREKEKEREKKGEKVSVFVCIGVCVFLRMYRSKAWIKT